MPIALPRPQTGWLASAAIAAVAAGCATRTSPPPVAPPARPAYECRFTEEPIVIDGDPGEAAWRAAPVIDDFLIPGLPEGSRTPARATRARLLWDRENLYVAADMDDGDLYADVTEHDGTTWDNDVFEIFLKPDRSQPAYYEFQVTPLNTQFDVFIPRRGLMSRFKRLHDFGIESAVRLRGTLDAWTDEDQGWSVELKIPWAGLAHTGGRPDAGAEWLFALCRYDYDMARDQPELSTCAPLPQLNFHQHEHYRQLRFVARPDATTGSPRGE